MSEYIITTHDEPDVDGSYRLIKPAEEIVRCIDCRWYREEWIRKLMHNRIYCDWLDGAHVEPEGFCAWGEKRSE